MKDKKSKTPFAVAQKIAPAIHAAALQNFDIVVLPGGGVVDGVDGDIIVLAPAYTVTKEDIDLIVEKTAKSIESVLGSTIPLAQL